MTLKYLFEITARTRLQLPEEIGFADRRFVLVLSTTKGLKIQGISEYMSNKEYPREFLVRSRLSLGFIFATASSLSEEDLPCCECPGAVTTNLAYLAS